MACWSMPSRSHQECRKGPWWPALWQKKSKHHAVVVMSWLRCRGAQELCLRQRVAFVRQSGSTLTSEQQ